MWSYTVIVLFCIQYVYGNDMCSSLFAINNCNDCMRCGATWCNNPNEPSHCKESSDDWCISGRETIPALKEATAPGTSLSYSKVFTTAYVRQPNLKTLSYKHSGADPKIHIKLLESSIKNLDENHYHIEQYPTQCEAGKQCIEITFRPLPGFCPTYGSGMETVSLQVQVGDIDETAVFTYYVPCECPCSKNVNTTVTCSGRGKYSCGACVCDEGWTGPECANKVRDKSGCDRGDVEGCIDRVTNKVCAGNGQCDCDGHCTCYERPDMKYYDEMCLDICSAIDFNCDFCFADPKEEQCEECEKFNLNFESFKNTSSTNDDSWMKCNVTIKDCLIQYQVKEEYGVYRVVVTDNCTPVAAAIYTYTVQVPMILGIIALLATVAAVAGFTIWKHRNPPLSAVDSGYGHIVPESSTGLNPLYKCPKSSFKNPMYGQNC